MNHKLTEDHREELRENVVRLPGRGYPQPNLHTSMQLPAFLKMMKEDKVASDMRRRFIS